MTTYNKITENYLDDKIFNYGLTETNLASTTFMAPTMVVRIKNNKPEK